VDVTGHPNNLTKGLQGKDNLIPEINDNKTFKIKLRLWESQLKLHKLVHSSHQNLCPLLTLSEFKNFRGTFLLRVESNE
jgi:hypothetical protein